MFDDSIEHARVQASSDSDCDYDNDVVWAELLTQASCRGRW